jgi:hypothetical protein
LFGDAGDEFATAQIVESEAKRRRHHGWRASSVRDALKNRLFGKPGQRGRLVPRFLIYWGAADPRLRERFNVRSRKHELLYSQSHSSMFGSAFHDEKVQYDIGAVMVTEAKRLGWLPSI